jgi:hypothetical protein
MVVTLEKPGFQLKSMEGKPGFDLDLIQVSDIRMNEQLSLVLIIYD